ncbi:Dak phosphatase [Aeromicrobium sp. PE09-221]|uniref:DAK2 domain-containing protein n=1 Tax=Aeromicrobium sp. PE09-221 TaxID=1898043 RepID=UPI000B3EDCE8|nr:DAK2 domain-containing protein [Aeromicrobium sp. PE09-221]OUZ09405.1 Dak phosphatase [Aeromicrobium sp. PE09-221]
MPLSLDPPRLRHWAVACAQSVASVRSEIDALNVFPVPDSDTGTNVYLTLQAGCDALEAVAVDASAEEAARAYARAVLVDARGNSGVIVAELLRACLEALVQHETVTPRGLAGAFGAAAAAAYAAVGDPQEGTILTVARAAADGAARSADAGCSPRQVVEVAADAAREALAATPGQMELLARAGVVDAGGRALVVILDATARVISGRTPLAVTDPVTAPAPAAAVDHGGGDGPGYEVMYLLDASAEAVDGLRETLTSFGDSLVIVGGEGLWNVHVHVDDVGAAIEAGIAAGRPHRIQVTHFGEQMRRADHATRRRVVVSAVTGAGLAELTRGAGAVAVEFSAGRPLTTAQMSQAMHILDAEEVIVLPNRSGHIRPFEAAAKELRDAGVRVAVLPTHAQVQALAALAVHDPGRDFDDDVVTMSAAAAHAKHGAVTIANESGITMAGPCEVGDVLGIVGGDFAVVGQDQLAVAREVLARLDSAGADMVTLVVGEGCPEELVSHLQDHLAAEHPHVDVIVHDGGQEKYTLFVAVE